MGICCSICCSFCKEYDNTDYILLHEPNIQDLIREAIRIYDSKYDYSLIPTNINPENKTEILCLIHGPFEMSLDQHVNKLEECPQCFDEKILESLV